MTVSEPKRIVAHISTARLLRGEVKTNFLLHLILPYFKIHKIICLLEKDEIVFLDEDGVSFLD